MEKGEDEVNQGAILSPRREDFFLEGERELTMTVFGSQRNFSTVLNSFCCILAPRLPGSNSQGCRRFIQLRTVTENFLICLKTAFFFFSLFTLYSLFLTNASADNAPERIISLAPSTTEILFALGLGEKIVGVTSFCDYPVEAREKAKIGGMSNPSLEAVLSLQPDIVVMTTDGNPKEFEARLRSLNIRTYVFTARRIRELPVAIRDMGRVLGAEEPSRMLSAEIEKAISRLGNNRPSDSRKKKVLFIVWPEPLIVAGPGTAIDDALDLLGVENIAGNAKTAYPKYSIEEVLYQSPDVIFIGKGMQANMREVSRGLLHKLGLVPAVKNGSVFFVSDSLYRLGPRIIKGIEELETCLK
ncbi:MAG: cobalamin-binding protein [Nitrospiraceae bacterium]|nr:MAG: cobalamin-binding protein [Nitrospiraceae bacterium]